LITDRNEISNLYIEVLNLVGSSYGRFSIKNVHFVAIHYQTWPPQAILFSDWLISKKSSPLKHWGSSKDASYQVSVHLAKRFQRKRFF
jgi:hypothetical protein